MYVILHNQLYKYEQAIAVKQIISRKVKLNKDWQDAELNPDFSEWVEKVEGENQYCKCWWCNPKFFLSGMGKGALSSHAKSQNT